MSTPFKMKGHTLPGINQRSETQILADGRSPSSAFQYKESPNKGLMDTVKKVVGGVKEGVSKVKDVAGKVKSVFSKEKE